MFNMNKNNVIVVFSFSTNQNPKTNPNKQVPILNLTINSAPINITPSQTVMSTQIMPSLFEPANPPSTYAQSSGNDIQNLDSFQ